MVMLRASGDAEAHHDLGEKRFAPGFREVLGDMKCQRVAPLTQRRFLFMEVSHPSIGIGYSRSDDIARTLQRHADSLRRPTECRVQHVRAESTHV